MIILWGREGLILEAFRFFSLRSMSMSMTLSLYINGQDLGVLLTTVLESHPLFLRRMLSLPEVSLIAATATARSRRVMDGTLRLLQMINDGTTFDLIFCPV